MICFQASCDLNNEVEEKKKVVAILRLVSQQMEITSWSKDQVDQMIASVNMVSQTLQRINGASVREIQNPEGRRHAQNFSFPLFPRP